MNYLVLISATIILFGCGRSNFQTLNTPPPNEKSQPPNSDFGSTEPANPPSRGPEVPLVLGPELQICSKLDIKNITWPIGLTNNEKNYLALALNVSGSMEGFKGWTNLSNNFDGMGISLGLFQQNLGMGSLQPLLIEFLSREIPLPTNLDPRLINELQEMLKNWKLEMALSANQSNDDELFKEDYQYLSGLDAQPDLGMLSLNYASNRASNIINKKSVSWALSELFIDGGKTFRSDWFGNLRNVAQTKNYISIQVKQSLKIFNKALLYFKRFGLSEIRSFLTVFDFVVQNGGFKKKVLAAYNSYLTANPKASETDKLLKILDLRLVDVSPKWKRDVFDRKKVIINSKGEIHGARRNLNLEFCYDPTGQIVTDTPLAKID